MNSCSNCKHSMVNSDYNNLLLCLVNGPSVLVMNKQFVSLFPSMQKWGKCSKHEDGATQLQNNAQN